MDMELVAVAAGAVGTALGGFWGRRSKGEKDANSAVALAKAYGGLVDDQRESLTDARQHIHRQDAELGLIRERHAEEIKALRDELRAVRDSRDAERRELEALRLELAAVREENGRLIARIATLEALRSTAPA